MSTDVPLKKALVEARRLVDRLSDREELLDGLIKEVTDVKLSIKSMQEYQEDTMVFSDISKVVNKGSKTPLILCLAAENKQLEQLDQQNKTLNKSLEEYEKTLEIVMSKYRLQMSQLMQVRDVERSDGSENATIPNNNQNTSEDTNIIPEGANSQMLERIINHLVQRLLALAEGAKSATEQSDAYTSHLEEELQQLRVENHGLRDLLGISQQQAPSQGNPPPTNLSVTQPLQDSSTTPSHPGDNVQLSIYNFVKFDQSAQSDRHDTQVDDHPTYSLEQHDMAPSPDRSIDGESDITLIDS